MKKYILILLLPFVCGCITTQNYTKNNNWLNHSVFQTLWNGEHVSYCLSRDVKWNYYFVISFDCPDKRTHEIFYDNKNLSGRYVLVGVYSYETKGGSSKTVQALMREENYNDLYYYDKEFLKGLLDGILSYSYIK